MNENILLVLSIVALIAVGGLAFKVLTEPPKKEKVRVEFYNYNFYKRIIDLILSLILIIAFIIPMIIIYFLILFIDNYDINFWNLNIIYLLILWCKMLWFSNNTKKR